MSSSKLSKLDQITALDIQNSFTTFGSNAIFDANPDIKTLCSLLNPQPSPDEYLAQKFPNLAPLVSQHRHHEREIKKVVQRISAHTEKDPENKLPDVKDIARRVQMLLEMREILLAEKEFLPASHEVMELNRIEFEYFDRQQRIMTELQRLNSQHPYDWPILENPEGFSLLLRFLKRTDPMLGLRIKPVVAEEDLHSLHRMKDQAVQEGKNDLAKAVEYFILVGKRGVLRRKTFKKIDGPFTESREAFDKKVAQFSDAQGLLRIWEFSPLFDAILSRSLHIMAVGSENLKHKDPDYFRKYFAENGRMITRAEERGYFDYQERLLKAVHNAMASIYAQTKSEPKMFRAINCTLRDILRPLELLEKKQEEAAVGRKEKHQEPSQPLRLSRKKHKKTEKVKAEVTEEKKEKSQDASLPPVSSQPPQPLSFALKKQKEKVKAEVAEEKKETPQNAILSSVSSQPPQPLSFSLIATNHFYYRLTNNVDAWFRFKSNNAEAIQSRFEQYVGQSDDDVEKMRIRHAFSRKVDLLIKNPTYVHQTPMGPHLVAEFTFADGTKEKGIISYGIDNSIAGKGVCYHRFFTTVACDQFLKKKLNVLLPKVPAADNSEKDSVDGKLNENGDTMTVDAFDIISIHDKGNNVGIKIFPIQ